MLRTRFPPCTYVLTLRSFLFTVESCVMPRPWGRTFHKCASLEFPSPYHFSRPDSLHEITPTIACHFHSSFELWIPFVIVAFSGTRVGPGSCPVRASKRAKNPSRSLAVMVSKVVVSTRRVLPHLFAGRA